MSNVSNKEKSVLETLSHNIVYLYNRNKKKTLAYYGKEGILMAHRIVLDKHFNFLEVCIMEEVN